MEAVPTTSFFTIPDWITEHPELRSRGITLEILLKPVRRSSIIKGYTLTRWPYPVHRMA